MVVIALEDVTTDHQDHDRLEHLATHDSLTGLVNRAFALEHLRRAGSRSGRSGQHLAVLFIDLDGFKAVNDVHGHAGGDAVIVEIAARITTSVRPGDTVARLSGDEFIVVCEGLGLDRSEARFEVVTIADRILLEVARPLPGIDPAMVVSASIGAVVAVGSAIPVPQLLARADQAMYDAKAAGGNRCRLADISSPSSTD
jgi:diguanylate cyclase (GGDEF)-like protein